MAEWVSAGLPGTDPATTQTPPTNGCSGPFCYSAPASNCSSDNTCTHHSGGNRCSINCLLQQNAAGNDPPLRFLHDNGYTGSNAFTVGDAIKWAGTGRMASVWVCEHVFGGSNEYCGDTAQGTDGPLKLLEVFAGSLAIAGVIVGSAACAEAYLICAERAFGIVGGIGGFFEYGGGGPMVEAGGVAGAGTALGKYDADFALGQLTMNGDTKASALIGFAEDQGWTLVKSPNGPRKFYDENGILRLTIKRGTPRAPGSNYPHVEVRDASGNRIDPFGNPVGRNDRANHVPIVWDLP